MESNGTTALKDRVVVITGAARGMGRAYVHAFLAAGAKVVATDRSWANVDKPENVLTAAGKNILIGDMDVTNDIQIKKNLSGGPGQVRHS